MEQQVQLLRTERSTWKEGTGNIIDGSRHVHPADVVSGARHALDRM
jgi:hypothetical protein